MSCMVSAPKEMKYNPLSNSRVLSRAVPCTMLVVFTTWPNTLRTVTSPDGKSGALINTWSSIGFGHKRRVPLGLIFSKLLAVGQ